MAKAEKADNRKPLYSIRARQEQTPEQARRREPPFYQTIGAIWRASWTDKETGEVVEGLSIKVNSFPANWSGDCVAVPYKEREKVE
jgi:hypothetical protein